MTNPAYLYRYRSAAALLHDYHELEAQEIYLASARELNDPMEGYRDMFWSGDTVLWTNFLKHYLLCLTDGFVQCSLMNDTHFIEPTIRAELTRSDLPTEGYRDIYDSVCASVLEMAVVKRFLGLVVDRTDPVRRHELLFHLSATHQHVVQELIKVLRTNGLIHAKERVLQEIDGDISRELLDRLNHENKAMSELTWEAAVKASEQLRLAHIFNSRRKGRSSEKRNWLYLYFPEKYLNALQTTLVHFPWYTACFSSACDNASMWSTYADHHRGAALMFRASIGASGHLVMNLRGVFGASYVEGRGSTPVWEYRECDLREVNYSQSPPVAEFFSNIATLPPAKLLPTWHCDSNGNPSAQVRERQGDKVSWRKRYWHDLHEGFLMKLLDWRHEAEYRLVDIDILGLREHHQKLKYDFPLLSGLVFGMRTSDEDKLAMIEIISQKCRDQKRSDFQFLQARYSPSASKIVIEPLSLLKFNNDPLT